MEHADVVIDGVPSVDITLVHGADAIYAPEPLQQRNLLLAGGSIVGILSDAEAQAVRNLPLGVQCLDASGLVVTPGFVDMHVHVTGGGGEAGPASRAPEARLSQLLNAGITTVVGVTGTDSVTRCQAALVAKCAALEAEGITARHWCGAYSLPVPTLTGDVQQDVALLPSCVGVGELAVADHRGSNPSAAELARIASDARVGGMLGGKPGLLHLHMGAGGPLRLDRESQDLERAPFLSLFDAVTVSDVPITQFLPTHCERTHNTRIGAADWIDAGGNVDLTAGEEARAALAVFHARFGGVGAETRERPYLRHISVSSDACGSFPVFDSEGRLMQYRVTQPSVMLDFVRALHHSGIRRAARSSGSSTPHGSPPKSPLAARETLSTDSWPLPRVLRLVTQNPAARLGLRRKGVIAKGTDADLLLLTPHGLELRYVFAKGRLVKTPEWVRGGMFEEGPGIKPHTVQ